MDGSRPRSRGDAAGAGRRGPWGPRRRPWTEEESAALAALWGRHGVPEIGRITGRGHEAIVRRAIELGLRDEGPDREPPESRLRPMVEQRYARLHPLKAEYGGGAIPRAVLDRVLPGGGGP